VARERNIQPHPTVVNRTDSLAALSKARLYGILDTGYSEPSDWPRLAGELIRGGVGILQVRAKNSTEDEIIRWTRAVLAVTQPVGIPLIINDHPGLVPLTGAEGCHIGQDDGTVAHARALAGAAALVGKSTHSLEQAETTAQEAPDYIGFGPIFATATKPDYIPIGPEHIRAMTEKIRLPAFCIGGIKKENTAQLAVLGARRVVIVSGLLLAPDPAAYARSVLGLLDSSTSG